MQTLPTSTGFIEELMIRKGFVSSSYVEIVSPQSEIYLFISFICLYSLKYTKKKNNAVVE